MLKIIKTKKKLFFSVVLLLTVFLIVIKYAYYINDKTKAYNNSIGESKEYGVLSWFESFTNMNFTSCDLMVTDSDKLIKSQGSSLINNISKELEIECYNFLVKSILSYEVSDISKNNGTTTYTLSVSYKKYNICNNLVLDKDKLSILCDDYTSGKVSNEDYLKQLNEVYSNCFNNCFILSDEVHTSKIKLSEKIVDGVTYVYYTRDFIDNLVSDTNIFKIVSFYESNIQKEVNKVMIQY